MKKFIYNLLLLLIPFAVMIATVNVVVDPAKIFSNGSFEKKIADILLKGHNVDRLRNFNQRVTLKHIVSKLPYKPNVCAIGTSRLFEMSSEIFPNKKFLNCSLSHANLRDYIAVIGLLDSCNKLPDEVYLDVSPMITIIDESDSDEWESIYEYYFLGLSHMNIPFNSSEKASLPFRLVKEKMTNFFSLSYFQKSFQAIPKMKQNVFKDVEKAIPQNFGKMSDFSVKYPADHYTSDTLKAMTSALFFVNKTTTPTVNYKGLNTLKQIISFLKMKKIKVTLVNIPFQTDFYNLFDAKSTFFKDLTVELNKIGGDMNVQILGSFNPNEANLKRSHFFDNTHCDKEALLNSLKIIKHIAQ